MSSPKTVRPVPASEAKSFTPAEAPATNAMVVKPPVPYEKRVQKMSTKQLRGEVKRIIRHPNDAHDTIFGTVLDIMLESQSRGLSSYLR